MDAVSTGANEVCGINSSELRGVGFVFNLAVPIDSGADEGTGQVGSAACVSPSPLAIAACFLLPFLLLAVLLVPGQFCCAKRFSFLKLFGGTKLPGGAVPVPLGLHTACSAAAFGDSSFQVSKVTRGKSSCGGTTKSSRRLFCRAGRWLQTL